jgi:hypothetical protein
MEVVDTDYVSRFNVDLYLFPGFVPRNRIMNFRRSDNDTLTKVFVHNCSEVNDKQMWARASNAWNYISMSNKSGSSTTTMMQCRNGTVSPPSINPWPYVNARHFL